MSPVARTSVPDAQFQPNWIDSSAAMSSLGLTWEMELMTFRIHVENVCRRGPGRWVIGGGSRRFLAFPRSCDPCCICPFNVCSGVGSAHKEISGPVPPVYSIIPVFLSWRNASGWGPSGVGYCREVGIGMDSRLQRRRHWQWRVSLIRCHLQLHTRWVEAPCMSGSWG